MNRQDFRNYCLAKKGAIEDFPFDATTVVFKVSGNIFALANAVEFNRISLKCDPSLAIELRGKYPVVIPGYHLNKRHWNMVILNGSIEDKQIYEWIDHSYNMVVSSLSQAGKQKLQER